MQAFMSGRGSELETAFGTPALGASGIGAMSAGSLAGFSNTSEDTGKMLDAMRDQNDLLRKILEKTGFRIDGRDMVDALGPPLVNELRQRTGL